MTKLISNKKYLLMREQVKPSNLLPYYFSSKSYHKKKVSHQTDERLYKTQ